MNDLEEALSFIHPNSKTSLKLHDLKKVILMYEGFGKVVK